MFAKYITAGLVGSALLAGVAFAQTPTTTTDRANTTLSEQSLRGDWRTSKVIGLSVYNDNKDNVGSIDDLLTDRSGNIKAVVLSVGGFLGVGSHLVAVPFDQIKFVNEPVSSTGAMGASTTTTGSSTNRSSTTSRSDTWYPDHALFNATKDQLKAMPEFKYAS
jgi:hypothetical protein